MDKTNLANDLVRAQHAQGEAQKALASAVQRILQWDGGTGAARSVQIQTPALPPVPATSRKLEIVANFAAKAEGRDKCDILFEEGSFTGRDGNLVPGLRTISEYARSAKRLTTVYEKFLQRGVQRGYLAFDESNIHGGEVQFFNRDAVCVAVMDGNGKLGKPPIDAQPDAEPLPEADTPQF